MIWGGLPMYAFDVGELIARSSAAFEVVDGKDNLYLNQRKAELEGLQKTLEAAEMSFFNTVLHLDAATPTAALLEFQKRITEIEQQNREFSLEEIQNSIFSDLDIIATLDNITTEAVDRALSSIDWEFDDIEDQEPFADDIDRVIALFTSIVTQGTDGKSGYFAKSSLENAKGLRRILEVSRGEKDNIFKVSIKEGEHVSSKLKNKLLKVIQNYTQKTVSQSKEEFKELVRKKLLLYVFHGGDSNIKSCLNYEIKARIDEYDLSRSFSSLKGFLQEIWTNAMASAIIGTPGTAFATGNVRNLATKQEIPVDMVLGGFNFQIKSYDLKNGHYEIRETQKEIGEFIKNRAQMNMSDLLIQFFGSYQFNQPFTKTSNDIIKSYVDELDWYRSSVYSQFEEVMAGLEPVFNSYTDRIIRLDSTFQGDRGPFFTEQQLYFNTFFVINNKIVPGSVMTQCIIESMEEQAAQQQEVIKFHLDKISKPVAGTNTLEEVILNNPDKKSRDNRFAGNVIDVANMIRISYRITFDFDTILNKAYTRSASIGVPK